MEKLRIFGLLPRTSEANQVTQLSQEIYEDYATAKMRLEELNECVDENNNKNLLKLVYSYVDVVDLRIRYPSRHITLLKATGVWEDVTKEVELALDTELKLDEESNKRFMMFTAVKKLAEAGWTLQETMDGLDGTVFYEDASKSGDK